MPREKPRKSARTSHRWIEDGLLNGRSSLAEIVDRLVDIGRDLAILFLDFPKVSSKVFPGFPVRTLSRLHAFLSLVQYPAHLVRHSLAFRSTKSLASSSLSESSRGFVIDSRILRPDLVINR